MRGGGGRGGGRERLLYMHSNIIILYRACVYVYICTQITWGIPHITAHILFRTMSQKLLTHIRTHNHTLASTVYYIYMYTHLWCPDS